MAAIKAQQNQILRAAFSAFSHFKNVTVKTSTKSTTWSTHM